MAAGRGRMSRRLQGRIARVAAVALVLLAALVAARGLERRNTWYLASDQLAFLTFADDLLRASVFHETDSFELLTARPPGERTYDAFDRTYFWSGDRIYSRYPPGYPALLALAGLVGGEVGRHLLNPLLYLALLGLLAATTGEILRPYDRSLAAGASVCVAWLLLVVPTHVHLWGITVVRDLPAHLLALAAVAAALVGGHASAGLLLGLAATVRPDAVLYAASLGAIFAVERARARDHVRAALGFVIGALPLFLYNTVTRGHPLAFTQGGEFTRLLSSLGGDGRVVLAQVLTMPSGGGFRLSHLPQSLPGNLAVLARSFAWTGLLAAAGVLWSVRVRPVLAAAFVPYVVLAVPFYSFWSHPDPRYLAGVSLCLMPLVAVGAVVVCWRAADPQTPLAERLALVAGALLVGTLGFLGLGRGGIRAAGAPEVALAAAVVVAALSSALRLAGGLRPVVLAPGLALAIVGLLRVASGSGGRDPFQQDRVERARAELGAVVPAGSLIVTRQSLGRPAENITRCTGAHAHYLSELRLLRSDTHVAAVQFALAGRRVFLLLDAGDEQTARSLASFARLRLVERRSGAKLYDWFVDPASAPRGADLYEATIPDDLLEQLRDVERRRREGQGLPPLPEG